ncbi:uncharacterized protein LOC125942428 [Dermacentor silvarum]|uniref:uncharacterized protein LOC125942428 n=1 Tax=Dermacentor silvarum TaxID=543639 RepID=UPI00210170E0|nr:uncharacterized protein LOC125942428 [Dermacentor silvarum]
MWHTTLAHSNGQLFVAHRSITERNGLGVVLAMGVDAPSVMRVYRLFPDGASCFSEASPSPKTTLPIPLDSYPEGGKDGVVYVSCYVAFNDVLTENLDLVIKAWNRAEELAGDSCLGDRRTPLPKTQCDLLVEIGIGDILSLGNNMHSACTVKGFRHQPLVVSWSPRRLVLQRSEEPIIRDVDAGVSGICQVMHRSAGASPEYNTSGRLELQAAHPRGRHTAVCADDAELHQGREEQRQVQRSNSQQLPLEATREVTSFPSRQQYDDVAAVRWTTFPGCTGQFVHHSSSVRRLAGSTSFW